MSLETQDTAKYGSSKIKQQGPPGVLALFNEAIGNGDYARLRTLFLESAVFIYAHEALPDGVIECSGSANAVALLERLNPRFNFTFVETHEEPDARDGRRLVHYEGQGGMMQADIFARIYPFRFKMTTSFARSASGEREQEGEVIESLGIVISPRVVSGTLFDQRLN